ncbi:zinc ABC transporter substrate-binding protein, partial [Candidatus Micrarchaeota archaeon]|nr:zinc ABC transporter substrate-binding protein [Candidatus Micrarchaeota archaeon]
MRFSKAYLAILAAFFILLGCISQTPQENGKMKVVASFYPLYDFASNVGGDRVEVSTLIPIGAEPHEFDPSPSDITSLN